MQDSVHLGKANVDVSWVAITFMASTLHQIYIVEFYGNPSNPEKHRPNIYTWNEGAFY